MRKLIVSSSPHIQSKRTTQSLMRDVIISLVPAVAAAGILFGLYSVILVLVCMLASVLFEYLFRSLIKRSNTISDLSAAVSGLILALNLPPTFPIWMAVIGCFIAIVIVKQMFGGIGQNIANPAMVARIALLVSFPLHMTAFSAPLVQYGAEAVTSATPLALVDTVSSATPLAADAQPPGLLQLFLGVNAGSLGEVCIVALLAGAVYLIIRGVISPIIPVCYIGSVALCYFVSGMDVLYFLMSGGLVLGACFMATDYVTSPLTNKGKVIFGVGCGLITFFIRRFGALNEGVSYAIVLMNLLVPLIDRATRTRAFGERNV